MPPIPPNHKPRIAMLQPRIANHVAPTRNRQKDRALHTGSDRWRLLRAKVLVRDCYVCAHCGRLGDESMHVDHRDGNAHNNDLANLQSLHPECHSILTAQSDAGFGNAKKERVARPSFDADGNPIGPAGKHWQT